MTPATYNRFKRGSGCFPCSVCKRLTRNTGDNAACELCPECYEVSGIENLILDHPQSPDIPRWEAEIAELNTQCKAKGGKL